MLACRNGHIDIARMLVGEYHASIEIRDSVRATDFSSVMMCEHVLSG